MTPDTVTFSDLIRMLKNRARPAALAALAVLLAMASYVFLSPAVYWSSATLLIEHMSIPAEMTGGINEQEFVEQRLQRTRQRVLTDDNVKVLIERHKLYESGFDEAALDEKLDTFKANVSFTPQVTGVIDPRSMRAAELTYAFDIGFSDSDPEVTATIANEIAQLFVSSSAAQAKEEAEREIEFTSTESERLASELRVRESRLSKFRQAHPVGLPDDRVRNQERAFVVERDLATVESDLRAARARKELFDAQLRETPRDSPVLDETGQVVLRGADRLAAAQQELLAARAKYSDDHPDVKRLKREIAQLNAEVAGGTSTQPTNPTYIQLQTQANAASIEVRELDARRTQLSSALATTRGAISLSPQLEEQYTDLVRDYEVIKTQYEQMRAQQATAELRSKAAASATESYLLINPARVPEDPVEPARAALMFLGIVLAIAAGLGTAYLYNAADATVRGGADVLALTGAEPFAHVPVIQSRAVIHRQRITTIALVSGIAAIAVLFMILAA
jgi:polysaccharide chain length determinant protein (PEP-CTERM system associated)